MTASQRFSPLARALIGGACFVIVLAGMRAAADLVNAFLLAMVITVSVSPFLHWLIRRGIPEKLAAAILIILVLAIVVVLLFTVFLSATQLVETFPEYGTRVEELKTDVERWLRARGIDLTETLTVEPLEPRQLVDAAIKALLYARDAVSGWALMILLVVFMLGEAANYPQKVFDAYASDSDALTRMSRLNTEIRQYMFITSWSGLLMAIANAVLLYALGVPFALLWVHPGNRLHHSAHPPHPSGAASPRRARGPFRHRRVQRDQRHCVQRAEADGRWEKTEPVAAGDHRLSGLVGLGTGSDRGDVGCARDHDREGCVA
jgi:AI-2 transport protein TqsA